jgi:hypothetical protein
MADALARFGPAQPGTTATTLITAGAAGTYTVIRHLHVVNTTAATQTITVGINGVTAALSLWFNFPIDPSDFLDWTGNVPLLGSATPDTLQALQSNAGALTVTVGAVTGP